MASIKFNVISKKNPSNLNIRFYHGRNIDCNSKSNILIDPKLWSNKMQNLKPLVDSSIKEDYRSKITNLKNEIVRKFNNDFSEGKLINSNWLKKIISEYYKRPSGENDFRVFLIPFIIEYIKESEYRINPKTGKKIARRTIQKYTTTLKQIREFEESKSLKYKITDVNLKFHKEFTTYLKLELKYSNTMIEKIISQLKSFVKGAKEKGYEYSTDIESRKFTFQRDETIETYLNEDEINIIYNLDFSNNNRLKNANMLFIIGLRTGLRISDLKRIHQFHFTKDSIIISATEKTGAVVEIPLHQQVKEILKKLNNELPRIISEQKFNEYIKEICQIAGLNQTILGYKMNKETNRKERGYFPKYSLVSSHICRRSFATNLYGKIPDRTIMAITTHKSILQFHKYIKLSNSEYAKQLSEHWNNENKIDKPKRNLKISY